MQYSYDKFDRTTKEQYNNVTYEYAYDASGQLAKQTSTAGEEYNYEYDSLGRLIRSNEYNDGTFEQRTEHIYDASNRLTKQSWYNVGGTTTMSYAYSTTTGLLSSLNATVQNSSIPVTYTYQGTNQLRSKAIGSVMTKAYNYCYNKDGGYRASLPDFVNYRDSSGNLIYGDNCHYDSNGRLVKILDSGSSTTTRATYGYDQQGQLTSATVGGTSYTYTYDTAGNIQSKKVGSTTTNYTYGNSAWRDLLTAYGGNTITYSGGNPTKYYDGSTFTWTQGRRLATAKVGSTNISYTYDMAGVRSSKTVGSTKYDFTTLSGLVTRQTGGGKTIDFVYDENNQPLAMKYNNTLYYYVLNAQGDVVRIVDGSRSVVASYTYDPWGKIISSSGTLADINPLRYRGYYYDSETGFYYLQSRYYDPEIGRFINADSYASTDATGLLSTNMFAYCENDPVNKSDPTGEVAPILVAMAGGAMVGLAEQFMTDVIYAMVTGQSLDACFSSVGTYVSSAVGGAMSVLPGGGVMRAFSELVLTTTIQTSIDAALAPQKYEKTTPYSEAIENVFTTGASKLGDKTASNVADKMFKSAAKQGKVGSKVTKAAAGALKSIKKYFGNAFNILLRIRDDMRQDKRGR
ncbi:MAG: RHS repeat-associated core domain-containing protein [Oscillospiraceae bacterium]